MSSAAVAPSRRERNKARTRTAILDAAAACIGHVGIHAATMDQIAADADVSRATLFNYFASKADIVAALVESNDEGFYAAIAGWREASGLSTGERILGLFAATGRYLRGISPIQRILVGVAELGWNDRTGLARVEKVIAAFADLIEDGRARGDVPPEVDVQVAAEIVADIYVGMIHYWRLADDYPILERLEAAARLIAASVSPAARLPDRAPRSPPR